MTIRQVLVAIPLLFLGWLTTLVVVGLSTDAAPASVVFFPDPDFVARLSDDFSIVATGRISVTLASDRPDMARRLYRSGAWLVLPAGLPGCLPLPRPGPGA